MVTFLRKTRVILFIIIAIALLLGVLDKDPIDTHAEV